MVVLSGGLTSTLGKVGDEVLMWKSTICTPYSYYCDMQGLAAEFIESLLYWADLTGVNARTVTGANTYHVRSTLYHKHVVSR